MSGDSKTTVAVLGSFWALRRGNVMQGVRSKADLQNRLLANFRLGVPATKTSAFPKKASASSTSSASPAAAASSTSSAGTTPSTSPAPPTMAGTTPSTSPAPSTMSTPAKEAKATRAGKKGVKKSWLKKWEVPPVRPLAPGRKAYMRGSEGRLVRRTSSAKGLQHAAQEYEDSKLAPGSRKAINARVAFWERRAAAHRLPPWPLDVQKLSLLGSLLLAGGYRSSASYFAAIKRKHLKTGGDWTPQMTQEVRDGIRSCTRGQGPDKQSTEVNLDKLARNVTRLSKHSSKWPVAGQDALLAMGHWMLREIEGGTARLADVTFLEGTGCGRAAWTLPCSKTDLRALGHQRVHGCCCPDASCPTATLRRVTKIATDLAKQTGKNPEEAPLFPDACGDFVEKVNMVACFQAVGEIIGVRKGITGHAPRVSGARRMARAGIELWQIQLFARWESAVILRYVREAPLAKSHLLAGRMAGQEDLNEIIDNTGDKALERVAAQEGPGWAVAVTKQIENITGEGIDGSRPFADKGIVKAAVEQVLSKKVTAGDLPDYVTNKRTHHSRTRAHRPRDANLAFCGWAWADAVKQGDADLWDSEGAELFPKCSSCAKAAFS